MTPTQECENAWKSKFGVAKTIKKRIKTAETQREIRNDVYEMEREMQKRFREMEADIRDNKKELEDKIQTVLENPLNDVE